MEDSPTSRPIAEGEAPNPAILSSFLVLAYVHSRCGIFPQKEAGQYRGSKRQDNRLGVLDRHTAFYNEVHL